MAQAVWACKLCATHLVAPQLILPTVAPSLAQDLNLGCSQESIQPKWLTYIRKRETRGREVKVRS